MIAQSLCFWSCQNGALVKNWWPIFNPKHVSTLGREPMEECFNFLRRATLLKIKVYSRSQEERKLSPRSGRKNTGKSRQNNRKQSKILKKKRLGPPLGPPRRFFCLFLFLMTFPIFSITTTTTLGAWGGLQTVQEAQNKQPPGPKISQDFPRFPKISQELSVGAPRARGARPREWHSFQPQ